MMTNNKVSHILFFSLHIFALLSILFNSHSIAQEDDYVIIKKSKYKSIEQIYNVARNYFIELESIYDPFLMDFYEMPWDDAIINIKDKGYNECDALNFTKSPNVRVLKNKYINNTYFFVILENDIIKYNKIVIFANKDKTKKNDYFRLLQSEAYPGNRAFCISLVYQLRTIEYQCFAINFSDISIFREMFFKDNYNHSLQLLYIMSMKGDHEASKRISEIESKYKVIAKELIKGKLNKTKDVSKYQKEPFYIIIGESFTFMPNILVNYWKELNM